MNPYQTLGVTQKATQDEIKNAYRNLAKKFHPDLNPGNQDAEHRFKDISAAFDLIGTPENRAKFDQGAIDQSSGKRPFYYHTQQQGPGHEAGGRYTRSFGEGVDEDLFESLFGGAKFRRQPDPRFQRQGDDIVLEVPVSLVDAVFGGEIRVPTLTGDVLLKVPRHSNTGTRLRLSGKGVYSREKKRRGDQLVLLKIRLPEPMDPQLEEALRQWRDRKAAA